MNIDELCAHFSDTLNSVSVIASEFEKIFDDINTNEKYPAIKSVYMHAIIINLGKIFSSSKNEPFRLTRFKTIPDLKSRVEEIENRHKHFINKINNNRSKISAHLDKKFYKLNFSAQHFKKLNAIYDKDFSKIIASNRSQERYDPIDMNDDIPEIKEILGVLDTIWKDALLYSARERQL
jgi:hypothetical protein